MDASATSEKEEKSDANQTVESLKKNKQSSTSGYIAPSFSMLTTSLDCPNTGNQQSSASELEKLTPKEIKFSGAEEREGVSEITSPTQPEENWTKTQQEDVDNLPTNEPIPSAAAEKKTIKDVFEKVKNRFPDWYTFKKFTLSSSGLNLDWDLFHQIMEETDLYSERKSLILEKWIENEKEATTQILLNRVETYIDFLHCHYTSKVKRFIPFALSCNGLCLNESDIHDIISNNHTSELEKIGQMRNKWEEKNERELTDEMLVQLMKKYEDAGFLTKTQHFLFDVKELQKFALSPIGLDLNESDIQDIIEDHDISKHVKIAKVKEKWESILENSKSQKDSRKKFEDEAEFEDLILKYFRKDCIAATSHRECILWIPDIKKRYSHKELHPLYGEVFNEESCTPISIWFVHIRDVKWDRIAKLKNLKKHNNVVPVVQVGNYRTNYTYVVMKHQLTETLGDVFLDRFDENLSTGLCLQLLLGLNFLHENDIVHCNLTPQTIFVSKDKRNLKLNGYHAIFPNEDDELLCNDYHAPEYVSSETISEKMNIYTAGNILFKILTNGNYPVRQLRSKSYSYIDLNPKYLLVPHKLLLGRLIQQMCSPDPARRPTALEALGDFTFIAYKINSDQSQYPSATFNLNILCRRTTKDAGEFFYWEQDATGKLTQIDQPQCVISKIRETDVRHVCIRNSKVTEDDIPSTTSGRKYIIEFRGCDISRSFLELFHDKMNPDCKITEFIVSFTKNISNLLKMICLIIGKWKIMSLSLAYDNLNDEDIGLIQECLRENKVEQLKQLDISYNKKFSQADYRQIGEMIREFKIETLKAADCNVTEKKLEKLIEGLGDSKLKHFDVSCNANLTKKGYECLARFVISRKVESLKLSACGLTEEVIHKFYTNLPSDVSEQMLEGLDISHNPELTLSKTIGPLIVKCGIKKLNLAACKINEENFLEIKQSTSEHKMNTMCIKDNFTIRGGVIEVAKFVKQCDLEELDIGDCMLTSSQLRAFRQTLGTVKLQRLHLGDEEREPDAFYIEEICKLLWNVEDVMYLQFHKLGKASRDLLWKEFVECSTNTSVKLSTGGVTEEWRKYDE